MGSFYGMAWVMTILNALVGVMMVILAIKYVVEEDLIGFLICAGVAATNLYVAYSNIKELNDQSYAKEH